MIAIIQRLNVAIISIFFRSDFFAVFWVRSSSSVSTLAPLVNGKRGQNSNQPRQNQPQQRQVELPEFWFLFTFAVLKLAFPRKKWLFCQLHRNNSRHFDPWCFFLVRRGIVIFAAFLLQIHQYLFHHQGLRLRNFKPSWWQVRLEFYVIILQSF